MSLRALKDLQKRLGVCLPESYLMVVEEQPLADIEQYQFYGLDQLCWYRDHALSKSVPLEGDALVIAEDVGGNVLLLLAHDLGDGLELGDEVYYLDHEVGEVEELAFDLLGLLEELGVAVTPGAKPIYESAFAVTATSRKVFAALTDALTLRGYGAPPEEIDRYGEYLHITVLGKGPVIVWFRAANESYLWLGRRLAAALKRGLTAYEVVVREQIVEMGDHGDDAEGFPVTTRRLEITADGSMMDRETGFEEEAANHGSPHETASVVLWQLLDNQTPGAAEQLTFYREPPDDDLTPRVRSLVTAILESGSVDMTEIAGQRAVRIELPDGTRQISVVNDEELDALRQHTDLG